MPEMEREGRVMACLVCLGLALSAASGGGGAVLALFEQGHKAPVNGEVLACTNHQAVPLVAKQNNGAYEYSGLGAGP